MSTKYLLYGVLACFSFIIFVGAITEIAGFSDYTIIAICIIFGTVIACTLYILEAIRDLLKDLNKDKDINN